MTNQAEPFPALPPREALGRLENGSFLEKLYEAFTEVSNECQALRKEGSVTVKIKIHPQPVGGRMVTPTVKITRSMPERDPEGAVLFYKDGQWFLNDPDQPSFGPMRVVEQPLVPPREVDGSPAQAKEVQ